MHRAKRAETHTTGWRMARPIILTVDDDVTVSQAITRDLRSRYADRYRIVRATSGAEALATLDELAQRDLQVALIVSDHRMPEMTGIELLDRSRPITPGTKRVLLTAYADTDVAIKAINDIGLDHYLMKPWAPPEERLYPVLDDLLEEWDRAQQPLRGRPGGRQQVVGTQLRHAHVPRPQPRGRTSGSNSNATPRRSVSTSCSTAPTRSSRWCCMTDGSVLRGASLPELADALGLQHQGRVGALRPRGRRRRAGRTGGRGVRARRRGCSVAVIERDAPGGQAGQSAAHRELPGFPERAQRFRPVAPGHHPGAGASVPRWCWPAPSWRWRPRGRIHAVRFDDGSEIEARAVIVATGVSYRLLAADGLASTDGSGRVLRRVGQRRPGDGGRRRVHRRCRQLRRTGGAASRPSSPSVWCCWCAATRSPPACRSTSSSASRRPRTST